jgi:hypothetical protein
MSLIQKIKDWYRGKYVPPPKNDPNSGVVFISPGYYEQPLLAKIIGGLCHFYLKHWQWVIGTMIAIIGIIVAL